MGGERLHWDRCLQMREVGNRQGGCPVLTPQFFKCDKVGNKDKVGNRQAARRLPTSQFFQVWRGGEQARSKEGGFPCPNFSKKVFLSLDLVVHLPLELWKEKISRQLVASTENGAILRRGRRHKTRMIFKSSFDALHLLLLEAILFFEWIGVNIDLNIFKFVECT